MSVYFCVNLWLFLKSKNDTKDKMTMNRLKISTIIAAIVLFCLGSSPITAGKPPDKRDPSPSVSADSALRQHRQNRVFLIDVRNRDAFEALKIPGSLNIPLYAVKTRPFLKSRPMVLVNEGFAASLLERECRQLNQKGFKAAILAGGLNAWRYRNGPLEGDLLQLKTFSTVSSRTYHQEKDFSNSIVIEVSEVRGSNSKQLIPAAIHLPQVGASANQPMHNRSLSDLRASVRENRKNPNSAILITNQDGKGYERIEKAIAKANLGSVFYLAGGLDGYRRFLDHLALSRKSP